MSPNTTRSVEEDFLLSPTPRESGEGSVEVSGEMSTPDTTAREDNARRVETDESTISQDLFMSTKPTL